VSMSDALEQALDQAELPERSAAAVALARRYARLLDEPTPAGKYRIPINHMRKVFADFRATTNMTPTEKRGLEQAEETILTALAEHSVASDLGPKFLQVLTALNMALPATAKPLTEGEKERAKPAHPFAEERAESARLRLVNGGQHNP